MLFAFLFTILFFSTVREMPYAAANGTNYLYTTEYNYMDFNVDDNGLWVIYSMPDSNNTIVAKVCTVMLNV